MRTIFLTLVSILFSIQLFAQGFNISVDEIDYGVWNDTSEKWKIVKSENTASLWKVNKDVTVLNHTTTTMNSTYYVRSKEYNERKKRYDLTVTSDVGNKYVILLDMLNKEIRVIGQNDDELFLVIHNIKSAWSDT